jgi:SulP family sulfate permease
MEPLRSLSHRSLLSGAPRSSSSSFRLDKDDSEPAATTTFVDLEPSSAHASFTRELLTSVQHGASRLARTVRVQTHASLKDASFKPAAVPKKLQREVSAASRFYGQNLVVLQREVLCGIAAMLLQIPETVAFSYVANLDPVMGLYATGFLGFAVSLFGGVPATVAGAAGALAVAMPTLTGSSGALKDLSYEERKEHLFVAITLVGIFQLVFGLLNLSKLFSMIPRTAHIGFLNGLAIMMFMSQMTTFEVCSVDDVRFGECEINGDLKWMSASSPATWITVTTVLVTMLIMHYFPRTPIVGRLIPPTLVVAILGVVFEHGINRQVIHYNLRTIGDTSPLSGGFPSFAVPSFTSVQNWSAVISTAASLAAIGLFESLMTCQAVVDLKKEQLSSRATKKECIAQGIGNIVCGFFSAMGGCSMIAQSTGNVLNGGRHRVSAFVGGLATFIVVLVASSVIELVPVACLTGILFVIILHTFYWPSLLLVFRVQITDAIAIVLVTALAAATNLAIAVIVGVIWQALVNGWTSGQQISMRTTTQSVEVVVVDPTPPSSPSSGAAVADNTTAAVLHNRYLTDRVEAKVYHIKGRLLFSSVSTFREFFDVVGDPRVVVLDVSDCVFADFSAVAALREAINRYREVDKTLVARHLDAHAVELLRHDIGWVFLDQITISPVAMATGDAVEAKLMIDVDEEDNASMRHLNIMSPYSPSTASFRALHDH